MSFLLRFPGNHPPAPLNRRERLAVWRSVQRGYRRELLRARAWRLTLVLATVGFSLLLLFAALK